MLSTKRPRLPANLSTNPQTLAKRANQTKLANSAKNRVRVLSLERMPVIERPVSGVSLAMHVIRDHVVYCVKPLILL